MSDVPFEKFTKIARLSRDIIVTEKLDGTNAQIYISDDHQFFCGSRTRYITPEDDNFGFARWAYLHEKELMALGPGRHHGEWWGSGIQRGYGLKEKHFSLFNVSRWDEAADLPACCEVVPVLYRGDFETDSILAVMNALLASGSIAAPGFMRPEGVVIYHAQGNFLFKKTFEHDDKGKSYSS